MLSIVIPVRDRQAPLDRLLAEIAAQAAAREAGAGSGDALEVVIVDDASTPPYAPPQDFPVPLRLARLDRRSGANAARRLGLALGRGDHVHFHDSDDGIAPGWLDAALAAIAAAAASTPQAGVIVTRRLDVIGAAQTPVRQAYAEAQRNRPDRIRRMLAFRNCIGPFGGVIFARTALEGVAFPDIASSQDWAVYRAVLAREPTIALAHEAQFLYRRDGEDRISASARRKALGMAGLLRGLGAGPRAALIRLYHLHYFRRSLIACDRRALRRILGRTRIIRPVAYCAALAYMAVALRWR